MALVGESNQVKVVIFEETQTEHASATGEEISRAAKQKQVERSAKNCKHKLNRVIKTCTSMLNKYQAEFPLVGYKSWKPRTLLKYLT